MPTLDPAAMEDANLAAFHSETRRELFAPYLASQREQARMLERYARPGRLFDFGCGAGHFLAAAARRGWEPEGVDVAAEACETARRDGIVIHRGRFEELAIPDGSFDAANLDHVLEHLPDPRRALVAAKRILGPRGLLAVGVPDPGALVHAARNLYHRLRGRLGHDRYSADLFPPFHLHAFPRRTLLWMLDRLGFAPLAVLSIPFGHPRWSAVFQVRYQGWSIRRAVELVLDAAARPAGRSSLLQVYARKTGA